MAVAAKEITKFVHELANIRNDLEDRLVEGKTVPPIQQQFIRELRLMKQAAAQDIRSGKFGTLTFGDVTVPPEKRLRVVTMLKVLVYPETKVGEYVASRIPQIPDLDLKARASQQVIDEIKHARVLRNMLERWGEDPDEMCINPLPEIERVFDYVSNLETVEEFFTANFLCEGLFVPSHLQVMSDLDPDAFAEYIEATLADEASHVALARDVIERYATTPEIQERCRQVAVTVTELFIEGFQSKVHALMELDDATEADTAKAM